MIGYRTRQHVMFKHLHHIFCTSSNHNITRRCVGSIRGESFLSTIKEKSEAEFQVVDVREPYEHELASIKKYVVVVELPFSKVDTWGPNISEKLDSEKTIYCLVYIHFCMFTSLQI